MCPQIHQTHPQTAFLILTSSYLTRQDARLKREDEDDDDDGGGADRRTRIRRRCELQDFIWRHLGDERHDDMSADDWLDELQHILQVAKA